MALPEPVRVPIASTIEASFSHADEFDFIDLRLAFDGIAFSSSPSTSDRYDGPWEDMPCEHADFLVYFSSVFCAFGDLVKFLESIALGVEQCSFHWEAEGPGGSLAWQRASQDGAGYLSVAWISKQSFRYVVRIDGKRAVRALYGAFREFVGSDSYDPIRYERMTVGETISLSLDIGDFERLSVELAKLGASDADALLRIANGGPGEREIRGPKRRYPLSECLARIEDEAAKAKNLGPAESVTTWVPDEWDGWTAERRQKEVATIMGMGDGPWYGANLRAMRSPMLEAWLESEDAA